MFLPVKRPPLALEFRAFGRSGFERQFSSCTAAGKGKLAVEKKSHFDFVANRMQLGIDGLMKFPQTPDTKF
jgi:hypothetical protein